MDDQGAAVLGAVAGAHHVNALAEAYGVSVILHRSLCTEVVAVG